MTFPSPSTFKLGFVVNRGYKQVRIEDIWKLWAANDNLFQGFEDIS